VVNRGALAALVFVIACGGSAKQPAEPISNTNKSGATDSSSGGPGQGKVIQRSRAGGVIELEGERGAAMEQAIKEMEAHCGPSAYVIVQEGEEAIADPDGGPGRMATAWRVHYQCTGN
jgi:hypothetical protein